LPLKGGGLAEKTGPDDGGGGGDRPETDQAVAKHREDPVLFAEGPAQCGVESPGKRTDRNPSASPPAAADLRQVRQILVCKIKGPCRAPSQDLTVEAQKEKFVVELLRCEVLMHVIGSAYQPHSTQTPILAQHCGLIGIFVVR